jgi:ElaB/YqjD/DUF883 family membrane-anchored ribosome-binding protein
MTATTSTDEESAKMGRAADDLKESAQRMKEHVGDCAGTVKDDLQDLARKAGRRVHDLTDAGTARAILRDKPIQTLGIALGVGFIAGMLFRR